MSLKAMLWVFYEEAQSKGEERLVLLALADQANDDGVCWPGAGTLAKKANIDSRSVRRCLHNLILKGLITVQQRRDRFGRDTTNLYRVVYNDQVEAIERVEGRYKISPYTQDGGGHSDTPTLDGGGGHNTPRRGTQHPPEGDTVPPESLNNPHITHRRRTSEISPSEIWQRIVAQNGFDEGWTPSKVKLLVDGVSPQSWDGRLLKIACNLSDMRMIYGIAAQRRRMEIATGVENCQLEVV